MARSPVSDSTQVPGYSSDPNEADTLFNGIPMQDFAFVNQNNPEYGTPPAPIGSTIPPVAYEKEPAPESPTDPQTNPPAENDPATGDGHGSCGGSGTNQYTTDEWYALYEYNQPFGDIDKSDDIHVGYMKLIYYGLDTTYGDIEFYDENMELIQNPENFPNYDYAVPLTTRNTNFGTLNFPESIIDKPAAKNQIPEIAAKVSQKRTQLELIEEAVGNLTDEQIANMVNYIQQYQGKIDAANAKVEELNNDVAKMPNVPGIYLVFRQFADDSADEGYTQEEYANLFSENPELIRPRIGNLLWASIAPKFIHPRTAHVYLLLVQGDGTINTYSFHPSEWKKGILDSDNASPARVWINDPSDFQLLGKAGEGPLKAEILLIEAGAVAALGFNRKLLSTIRRTGLGIEEGRHIIIPGTKNPIQTRGLVQSKPPAQSTFQYSFSSKHSDGMNCGGWATTMLRQGGIAIPDNMRERIKKYNFNRGIEKSDRQRLFNDLRNGKFR